MSEKKLEKKSKKETENNSNKIIKSSKTILQVSPKNNRSAFFKSMLESGSSVDDIIEIIKAENKAKYDGLDLLGKIKKMQEEEVPMMTHQKKN